MPESSSKPDCLGSRSGAAIYPRACRWRHDAKSFDGRISPHIRLRRTGDNAWRGRLRRLAAPCSFPTTNSPTNARKNWLSHFSRKSLIRIGVILRTSDSASPQDRRRENWNWPKVAENSGQLKHEVRKPKVKNPARLGAQRGCSFAKRVSLQRVSGGAGGI